MLANCRFVSLSWVVITGAKTEIVSRSMKLISVARKTSVTIHQRNPRTILPGEESTKVLSEMFKRVSRVVGQYHLRKRVGQTCRNTPASQKPTRLRRWY